ncbi:hypothetical protein PR048_005510 [Dryococelus australis]|uniref:Uncharacterized protein n=1 Tax=Dryococelus australis TaxID=614101 RepID=A0ABQ9I9G2_9NEOP|nr:hypothetical protein PR048_005510 [Dryococelus australis]
MKSLNLRTNVCNIYNLQQFSKNNGHKVRITNALSLTVKVSKLFVDKGMLWLVAIPNDLIIIDSIAAVECPFIAAHVTPQQAVEQNEIKFRHLESGKLCLKENDRHLY